MASPLPALLALGHAALAGAPLDPTSAAPARAVEEVRAVIGQVELPNTERPDTETGELSLFVAANLDGVLARARCREGPLLPEINRYYAQQVAFFAQIAASAAARPERVPIALNVGDSIFPGAIARYLLTQGEPGALMLARILAEVPYALHGLGNHDLSPPRDEVADFVDAAPAAGLTLRVANLRCREGQTRALCKVGPSSERPGYVLVERGRFRIGVVAVLDPQVAETLSRHQLSGLEILEPREALAPLVQRLREREKVDLVVVLFHITAADAVGRAQQLATAMRGIDLIATNTLFAGAIGGGEEASTRETGYIVAPQTGTIVVGANTDGRHVLTVQLQVGRSGGDRWRVRRMRAQRAAVDDLAPDPETSHLLEQAAEDFCRDWGQPIRPDLGLAKPFTLEGFETFVLNVMRFSTESEIAIANALAFRAAPQFPLNGTLTRADVYAALPFSNRLMTIRLKGSALLELTPRLGGGLLVAAGMERNADEKWVVNGRPIDRDRHYTVAINQYLAEGGDHVFTPKQVANAQTYEVPWSEDPPAINDLVIHFIETGEYQRLGGVETARLDPAGNFPDLFRNLLWRYTGAVTLGFNRSSVDNPASAYSASQLTVSSTDQLNLEVKGLVHAESRMHGIDEELLAQYAAARLPGATYQATKDLIRLRSAYKLLGVRSLYHDSPWVPVPFAELQLETEFQRAPSGSIEVGRNWRRVQPTGIVGASIRPWQPLELRLGFNLRRDLNAPRSDPTSRSNYGLNVGYVLQRFDLTEVGGRPIQLESDLDYFFNDLGRANISEMRSNLKLNFGIFDQLFFTTTLSAYLYWAKPERRLGSATQVTIGLNYLFDYTAQSF